MSFSAIARSVMISASIQSLRTRSTFGFSAIARSVMISAMLVLLLRVATSGFSAIARSVMISANYSQTNYQDHHVSVL